jgi:hypothetical protein
VRSPIRTTPQADEPPAGGCRRRAHTDVPAQAAALAVTFRAGAVPAQAAAAGPKLSPAEYLSAGATGIVQVDAVRVGGITRVGPMSMGAWVRPPYAPDVGVDRGLDAADDLRVN